MDAFEFVVKYPDYLREIKSVIKPELYPVIEELEQIDPHDLVPPEAWFRIENDARGMVWALFVKKAKTVQIYSFKS